MNRTNIVCGFHAVDSALDDQNNLIGELLHDGDRVDKRINQILMKARKNGLKIRRSNKGELDSISDYSRHQGILAILTTSLIYNIGDLKKDLKAVTSNTLFLCIDGVEDPRNIGSCIRTAAAAGVNGIILSKSNGSRITPTVIRVASGGFNVSKVYEVTNLSSALKICSAAGLWVIGAAEEASVQLSDFDLKRPIIAVVGSEEKGLRSLTVKSCDQCISIPTNKKIRSLNVAVATGIFLFEIRRQQS